MSRRAFVLTACLAVLLAALPAFAQAGGEATAKKTVRVLAVGNSFSENATQHLPGLVEAAGHELILRKATIGGASLQRHWDRVEIAENDPTAEAGKYGGKTTLREMLAEQPWDYVTIQQYSWLSHDPSTQEPWATRLVEYIRTFAPTAKILVHQTWAYRVDDPRFDPEHEKYGQPESSTGGAGGPKTMEEMYERLTAAYDELAVRVGAERVIPAGDSIYRADTNETWGFKPSATPVDPAAFTQPDVPANEARSMHGGWAWRKQKDGTFKLTYDGHHAGNAGKYLGACVWFEVLFDESVVGNTYVPPGIDADYAAFLRETAHEAVAAREAAVAQ